MNVLQRVSRLPAGVFVLLIRGYQRIISPWTAASCRYYPSCSQYAVEAISVHGVLRGGWLAARRLGRCHPWTAGGVDHVPARSTHRATAAAPVTSAPSTVTGV